MYYDHSQELINVIGLGNGGQVVIAHGTEEQKQRYLRPLLAGDEIWCQGFSEPNAGSDLSGLQTRAEDNGDHYVRSEEHTSELQSLTNLVCRLLLEKKKKKKKKQ